MNKFVRYIITHYTSLLLLLFILYYFTIFSPVNFVNINFIISRFFNCIIKSKGIKASFFAKLLFSKKKIDVIISEIFLDINK